MMTIYDFVRLKSDDQADAVWDGTFLADRAYKGMHFQLYAIGDFYVELAYDAKSNQIIRIKPFSTPRLLLPYWKQVSIQEIEDLL